MPRGKCVFLIQNSAFPYRIYDKLLLWTALNIIACMKEIGWLTEARMQYKSPEKFTVRVETNFSRAYQTTTDILERKTLPVNTKPNILIVGVGCQGGGSNPLVCTYSPFVIASFLENRGVQYRMTVVDILNSIIQDVRARKNIYISEFAFEEYDMEGDWLRFLNETGQKGKIVYKREEGLAFDEYTEKHEALFTPEYHLKRGIRAAEIPKGFREKLQTGEVSLENDDIAIAELSSHGPFDYVECTNVLYHLPTDGQMLALANITFSLNAGGLVLINDMGDYNGNTPLFKKLGGWLDEEKLRQLGLIVDECNYKVDFIEDGRYRDKIEIIRVLLKKE